MVPLLNFLVASLLTSPRVRDSRRLRDKTHPADNYNVQPKSGTTVDLFFTSLLVSRLASPGVRDSRSLRDETHTADNTTIRFLSSV